MKIRLLISLLFCFILSTHVNAATPAAAPVAVESPVASTINLNTADVKTLSKSVKGIGLKRAEAIVKYRETHDGFKSVTELEQVPGLGKRFVETRKEELERVFSIK